MYQSTGSLFKSQKLGSLPPQYGNEYVCNVISLSNNIKDELQCGKLMATFKKISLKWL